MAAFFFYIFYNYIVVKYINIWYNKNRKREREQKGALRWSSIMKASHILMNFR